MISEWLEQLLMGFHNQRGADAKHDSYLVQHRHPRDGSVEQTIFPKLFYRFYPLLPLLPGRISPLPMSCPGYRYLYRNDHGKPVPFAAPANAYGLSSSLLR